MMEEDAHFLKSGDITLIHNLANRQLYKSQWTQEIKKKALKVSNFKKLHMAHRIMPFSLLIVLSIRFRNCSELNGGKLFSSLNTFLNRNF